MNSSNNATGLGPDDCHKDLKQSTFAGTRKIASFSWAGGSQGKPWWTTVTVLTCKSLVGSRQRGERLIELSSELVARDSRAPHTRPSPRGSAGGVCCGVMPASRYRGNNKIVAGPGRRDKLERGISFRDDMIGKTIPWRAGGWGDPLPIWPS